MRWPRPGALARGIAVVLGVAAVVAVTSRVTLIDLAVYRAGAAAVLDRTSLYDVHPPGSLLPFTYPPFASLAFVPLAWLAQEPAQVLFTVASIAALVRVCSLVLAEARRAGSRAASGAALVAVVGVALLAEPVARTLAFGQVNLVLMWVVVEDVLGLGARLPRAQGVLVGLAAGVKLVPAAFALLFVVVGRLRAAVVAGVVFLGTVAVGFLVEPEASHAYWTGLLFDAARMGDVAAVVNQSLLGAVSRSLPDGVARVLWVPLVAGTLLMCLGLARWYWRRGLRLVALAVVACAGLLCSPISWSHHWVWFVVVVGACAELSYLRAVRVVGVLAAGAALSWVVWWGGTAAAESLPAPVGFVVTNAYVLVALAFLAVLGWARRYVVALEPVAVEPPTDRDAGPWPDERTGAVPLS